MFTERISRNPNATRMAIDRSPQSFKYIHSYLQGYPIPVDISTENLAYLKADAQYYKLSGLLQIVNTLEQHRYNTEHSKQNPDVSKIDKTEARSSDITKVWTVI